MWLQNIRLFGKMSLKISIKGTPNSFKSVALENALRNIGKLPLLMAKIGSNVTEEIKRNLSGRVLQKRSGRLHDSWTWNIAASNAGWTVTILSEGVPYARIHEFGGWTGRGHQTFIPARYYVSLAVQKQVKNIVKLLKNYMARIFYA